jgi:hypothetical protein
MKIIIQNGGNHALSRAVIERVLAECPSSWRSAVADLAICADTSDVPHVTYHGNQQSLSVKGPRNPTGLSAVLAEVLTSLSIIAERSELPSRLGAHARAEHAAAANVVLQKTGLYA